MTPPRRRVLLPVLGFTQILGWGSTYYLPAVVSDPIAREMGWPLPLVSLGLTLAMLVAGAMSPFVGRRIQRLGGAHVMPPSAPLFGIGLALVGVAPNLPVYFAGWFVVGLGMGAGLYEAAFGTLARYYGQGAGTAIATLTLFGGFASTICWPLSAALVEAVGWRGTCFAYAGVHLLLDFPALKLVLPAAAPVAAAAGGGQAAARLDGRERRAFLLLAVIVPMAGTISTLLFAHLMTLLGARGIEFATAVALGALIGPAQVAARIAQMAGGRRATPLATLIAAGGLAALGLVLLGTGLTGVAVALILYGSGNGIFSIARATLPLVLFGPGRYAVLMGRIAVPNLVAQALAPLAGALLIEHVGAVSVLDILAAASCLNAALILTLARLSRGVAAPA
jgi:MFS family permease